MQREEKPKPMRMILSGHDSVFSSSCGPADCREDSNQNLCTALLYPDLLARCEGSNAETQRARRDAENGERKSSSPLRCSAPSASLR